MSWIDCELILQSIGEEHKGFKFKKRNLPDTKIQYRENHDNKKRIIDGEQKMVSNVRFKNVQYHAKKNQRECVCVCLRVRMRVCMKERERVGKRAGKLLCVHSRCRDLCKSLLFKSPWRDFDKDEGISIT